MKHLGMIPALIPLFSCMWLTLKGVLSCTYNQYICARESLLGPRTYSADIKEGVSICLPVSTVTRNDIGLSYTFMESYFQVTHPNVEVLVCLEDANDPVAGIVDKLRQSYPHVSCDTIIDSTDYAHADLKLYGTMPCFMAAKYDVVWVSMCETPPSADYLLSTLDSTLRDRNVAAVYLLPSVMERHSYSGIIETIYLGCHWSKYCTTLDNSELVTYRGLSYLARKSAVDQLKSKFRLFRYLRYPSTICSSLVECSKSPKNFNSSAAQCNASLSAFVDRMKRLSISKMKKNPFYTILTEPLQHAIPMAVLMSWCIYYFFSTTPWLVVAPNVHMVLVCLVDYLYLKTIIIHGITDVNIIDYIAAWLLHEFLYIYIYLYTVFAVVGLSFRTSRRKLLLDLDSSSII